MRVPLKFQAIVQRIIEGSQGKLKFGAVKKGALRFNKTNYKDKELDIFNILSRAQCEILVVLPPKEQESASSKFLTYGVKDITTFGDYKLVFAGCGNAGHHFELKTEDHIKQDILSKTIETNPILISLAKFQAVSLELNHPLLPIEVKKPNIYPPKRNLSLSLENVGSIIADLSLTLLNGETVYLSLKNIEGSTFSNNGIGKAFRMENNFIVPQQSSVDGIFYAFGIDKQKISNGCNAYQQKRYYAKEVNLFPQINPEQVLTYLRSGFGYGYWYIREQRKSEYQIIDLTTLSKLTEYVPNVGVTQISYPYYHTEKEKSKQCSVDMAINIHETNPTKIRAEIRNTKGYVIPTEFKLLKK